MLGVIRFVFHSFACLLVFFLDLCGLLLVFGLGVRGKESGLFG